MSSAQLMVSVREKEPNGKDAVTKRNLFKLEAGLQFKKRDYRSNNMGLNCLRVCPLLKQLYCKCDTINTSQTTAEQ